MTVGKEIRRGTTLGVKQLNQQHVGVGWPLGWTLSILHIRQSGDVNELSRSAPKANGPADYVYI